MAETSVVADELTSLREFLDRLKSGELRILRGEQDVTESQIAILGREIAFLNAVLIWLKAGGRVAAGLKSQEQLKD
jgi:alanine dehydrogenase